MAAEGIWDGVHKLGAAESLNISDSVEPDKPSLSISVASRRD
jgi:hypothetical protein